MVGTQRCDSESNTEPAAHDMVTSSVLEWPYPHPIAMAIEGETARARVARSIFVFKGLSFTWSCAEKHSTSGETVKDDILGRIETKAA